MIQNNIFVLATIHYIMKRKNLQVPKTLFCKRFYRRNPHLWIDYGETVLYTDFQSGRERSKISGNERNRETWILYLDTPTGVPLGGIGTGMIELRSDGRIGTVGCNSNWSAPFTDTPGCFFAVGMKNGEGREEIRLLQDGAEGGWTGFASGRNILSRKSPMRAAARYSRRS